MNVNVSNAFAVKFMVFYVAKHFIWLGDGNHGKLLKQP